MGSGAVMSSLSSGVRRALARLLYPAAAFALALLAVLAAAPAFARAPILEDFLTPVSLADAAISPDGKRVALLEFQDGASRVKVVSAVSMDAAAAVPIELGSVRAIWIDWVAQDRLAIGTVSRGGWQNLAGLPFIRVMTVSPDGSDPVTLFANAREFAWNPDLSGLVHKLPDDPRRILMSAGDEKGVYNLYLVDIFTGEATLAEQGSLHTKAWFADQAGRPRVRIDEVEGWRQRQIFAKQPDGGAWTRIAQYHIYSAPPLEQMVPTDDPNIVLLKARPSGDTFGLHQYDLRANRLGRRIYRRSDFDIEGAVAAPATRLPAGARYIAVKPEIAFFDTRRYGALARAIDGLGPDAAIVSLDSDAAEKLWVARVESPQDPGSFRLLDVAKGTSRLIGPMRPGLSSTDLAAVTAYTYRARDRLEIPAYLTLPANVTARSLPLIVMPHGGPEARDTLGFDSLAQFLAARGYAIFQPNFRGSSGYGEAYAQRGYREWGGKMQTDLIDGLDDLVAKGIADPNRVCIVGSSYGGYAALAAGLLTPERFKCSVAVAGVSDLVDTVLAARAEFGDGSPTYAYVENSIGRYPEDEAELIAKSPARNAARMGLPVLLAHGHKDDRVAFAQSVKMRDAMVSAGRSVALLEMPQSTHTYFHPYDLRTLMETMDVFLARHLLAQVSALDALTIPRGFTQTGEAERFGHAPARTDVGADDMAAAHMLPLNLRTMASYPPLSGE